MRPCEGVVAEAGGTGRPKPAYGFSGTFVNLRMTVLSPVLINFTACPTPAEERGLAVRLIN
jgi:hypothetical protein